MISVIVPIYNVEKYLRQCLDSIRNQTYRDLEVILVDDCSPDGSAAICREYVDADPRFQIVRTPANSGLSAARNAGIEVATGDWIAYIDSDDDIDLDYFERLLKRAEATGADVVRCTFDRFSSSGPLPTPVYFSDDMEIDDPQALQRLALRLLAAPTPGSGDRDIVIGCSVWMTLYHRRFTHELGMRFPHDRTFTSEDVIFNFGVWRAARKLAIMKRPMYHYRENDSSLTRALKPDCIERVVRFCRYGEKMVKEAGYSNEDLLYVKGYAIEIFRAYLKQMVLSDMPRRELYRWLKEQAENPYIKEIYEQYPWRELPLKYRSGFQAFAEGHPRRLSALIKGREMLRGLLGK